MTTQLARNAPLDAALRPSGCLSNTLNGAAKIVPTLILVDRGNLTGGISRVGPVGMAATVYRRL